MNATLIIAGSPTWMGDTNIYALDTPHGGHNFLAVSVFGARAFTPDDEPAEPHNAGVQIVGCDETGAASSLDVILQTYEILDHAGALAWLGYEVQP